MSKNPHYQRASVGDLVIVTVVRTSYKPVHGARAWLESEVAQVTAVGENRRIKAMRFALDGFTRRRKYLEGLACLTPYPADKISVPLAMRAAKERGKPFASLEDVRAVVRPFVLADLAANGYDPSIGEQAAADAEDNPTPPTVTDMRAIFGEPVEGRDYDVMPGGA